MITRSTIQPDSPALFQEGYQINFYNSHSGIAIAYGGICAFQQVMEMRVVTTIGVISDQTVLAALSTDRAKHYRLTITAA